MRLNAISLQVVRSHLLFAYLKMQTVPIRQVITIFVLIVAIAIAISLLPGMVHVGDASQAEDIKKRALKNSIEASPSFRFTSKPKAVTIKDNEGKVIYFQEDFDSENEHTEFNKMKCFYDNNGMSELQLIIEWSSEPTPFHFFSLEFEGYDNAKYATSATSDIFETIILKW